MTEAEQCFYLRVSIGCLLLKGVGVLSGLFTAETSKRACLISVQAAPAISVLRHKAEKFLLEGLLLKNRICIN